MPRVGWKKTPRCNELRRILRGALLGLRMKPDRFDPLKIQAVYGRAGSDEQLAAKVAQVTDEMTALGLDGEAEAHAIMDELGMATEPNAPAACACGRPARSRGSSLKGLFGGKKCLKCLIEERRLLL